MNKNKIKTIVKVGAILVVGLIAGLVLLTIVPEFGGYKALVVTTSSMEPTIKVGGIVFVKKAAEYSVGDVVTFQQGLDPKSLTTHRVIDVKDINDRRLFETKGDAVDQSDIELISENRIVGKVLFSLPFVGRPIVFAKTQLGVVVLVVIPAAIIVYEEIKSIGREVKNLRKKVGKLEREASRVTVSKAKKNQGPSEKKP